MKEQDYDDLLNIKTVGVQQGYNQSFHYHRYEPTPYQALEELANVYKLNSSDRVVDFGCGKGRLNFFLNHLFNAYVVGIEMNEAFYQDALQNQISYLKKYKKSKEKIEFECCLAEKYPIHPLDNRFYFFNPFTIPIFWKVINNILLSVEKYKREIDIILYYPSEDYIYFLENHTLFELKEEVIIQELYKHNHNERFLIYRLS